MKAGTTPTEADMKLGKMAVVKDVFLGVLKDGIRVTNLELDILDGEGNKLGKVELSGAFIIPRTYFKVVEENDVEVTA